MHTTCSHALPVLPGSPLAYQLNTGRCDALQQIPHCLLLYSTISHYLPLSPTISHHLPLAPTATNLRVHPTAENLLPSPDISQYLTPQQISYYLPLSPASSHYLPPQQISPADALAAQSRFGTLYTTKVTSGGCAYADACRVTTFGPRQLSTRT